jgi:medium-chain acyl-[acyl-carrier-protein] hydrolase
MTSAQLINSWVIFPKPNPQARIRLFCFPYAGGGTLAFRDWIKNLPPDVDLSLVQLPGHDSRLKEQPLTHLTPLLEVMIPALLPYLNQPFAFYGHSMGALLCFEAARLLYQEYNLEPAHLFVSGSRAPQLPSRLIPTHHLPDVRFASELRRRYNAIPDAVFNNTEIMQFFLPILRADFSIIETYEYIEGLPLPCPISAFGGLHDEMVAIDEISAWKQQTSNQFFLQMLPGDHFFINTAQDKFLEMISQQLQSF